MPKKCRICGSSMTKSPMGYKCNGCTNIEPAGPNKEVMPVVFLLLGGILVLSLMVLFFFIPGFRRNPVQEVALDNEQDYSIEIHEEEIEEETEKEIEEKNEETDVVTVTEAEGFQSDTMREMVSEIFGKNTEEVTKEELATIQYIEMNDLRNKDGVILRYSTEDYHEYLPDTRDEVPDYTEEVPFAYTEEFRDTLRTVCIQLVDGEEETIYKDLEHFKGVKALDLQSYSSIDLSKLPSLSMLVCNGTDISTLLQANVPVDRIESLHAQTIDLDGIEQFTALKRLYLNSNDFWELEEVIGCKNLEELYCIRLDGDRNYEILRQMPELKTLYIAGSFAGLEDLSVLGDLTALESLTIVDTEIARADFLKELQNLKVLRLSGNFWLEDMSALGEVPNLEYLELSINPSYGMQYEYTSVKNLKNLEKLVLKNIYELDFLYELDQLKDLKIDFTYCDNFMAPIAQMNNLERLSLISCYSKSPDNYACLKELPNLKYLRMEGMDFTEPVEELFSLENVEELHIVSCNMEVSPSNVLVSDKLKVLDLSATNFRMMPVHGEYIYMGYEDTETFQKVLDKYLQVASLEELYLDWCNFEDLSGVENLSNLEVLSLARCNLPELPNTSLEGCESLRKLYLQGNQIRDISFVENLPALKHIDLWDCYVTDLSPLEKCEKLDYVNVKNNPIAGNPLVGVEVIIK